MKVLNNILNFIDQYKWVRLNGILTNKYDTQIK